MAFHADTACLAPLCTSSLAALPSTACKARHADTVCQATSAGMQQGFDAP